MLCREASKLKYGHLLELSEIYAIPYMPKNKQKEVIQKLQKLASSDKPVDIERDRKQLRQIMKGKL